MNEFALIERIRARCRPRSDVVLGIGDDAALLQLPVGEQLVVSTDTLVAGVHFPNDTAAEAIGWKALAVNLSDLAAMAATPRWCTLALTLPDSDSDWLDGFLDGFFSLADQHEVGLIGGDTTRGPLSITITALGSVPAGAALRRDGAQVGDDIWVTGMLGDAAGALALLRERGVNLLRERLDRPTPRVDAGLALRGLAHSAIDISDGLLADLGHVLAASAVGARIELARLPTSSALSEQFSDTSRRWPLQVAGGDDYELCFSAPASRADSIAAALRACATPATVIGQVVSEPGLVVSAPEGAVWTPTALGFDHFSVATTP